MKNIHICACLLFMFACADSTADFLQQKLDSLASLSLTPVEVEKELLQLESDFPDEAIPKLKLGIFYLKAGLFQKARIYLNRIQNPEFCLREGDISDYYLALAQLSLFENDIRSAKIHIDQAAQKSKLTVESLNIIKARIHSLENEKDAAFSLYTEVWNQKKYQSTFTLPDLYSFLNQAIERLEWELALNLMQHIEDLIGYRSSNTMITAMLYEKMQCYEESLITFFLELDARLKAGAITQNECLVQFDSFYGSIGNEPKLIELKRKLKNILSGSDSFESPIVFKNNEILGIKYIHFLEKLNAKQVSQKDIMEFINLGQKLAFHPGYHIALWKGLELLPEKYCLKTVQPVLENIIDLCQGSHMQNRARKELGRLIGITEAQSTYLLIHSEINAIAKEYTANGQEEALIPVFKILALENNPYTEYAAFVLGELKHIGEVKNILTSLHNQAENDFKIRLANIIKS